ncbi:MAG: M20/M25/M40 family metallo-hydrolase [Vicinamibacterales bacterium]
MSGSVDPVALARELIDIDSTTGREGRVAAHLAGLLRTRGYSVLEQPIDSASEGDLPRANVIAAVGEPALVFSTHLDCVPPFFPSRLEGDVLYGRGACDAKGILAAQIAAAERLRASGETRVGLVFVAGEERGSEGAMAANRIASTSAFLVNGEPTDNRLGLATRGVFRVRLSASGRAAHSGYPQLGESAIDKLIDGLMALRAIEWPSDPELGTTHYTVGLMSGGVAPNVVPAHAQAEIVFRTVGDHDAIREGLRRAVDDRLTITEVLEVPSVRLTTRPGFETAVFAYTTDIPLLSNWGTPLLLGPGSIHVAHTDHEHVLTRDLCGAVDAYERLARGLLDTLSR